MRACSTLAVALLVPSAALAAPSTDEPSPIIATIAIDFAPAPGVPAWFAESFAETVVHDLGAFERLGVRRDVVLAVCGADRECRLRTYHTAGVDIVLFGTVGDEAIAYELYQTWTPARLDTGTMSIGRGQSLAGLEHATRDALHAVLKHGGLLDQKPYLVDRQAGGPAAATRWTGRTLAILATLLGLLALPFLLGLIGGERPAALAKLRSARRVLAVAAVSALAVLLLDPARIAAIIGASAWLVAGIGGLGWGAFFVLVVRTAFPPLDGLERVPQGELGRFLSTWCLAALERLAGLAIVNVLLVGLVAWLAASFAIAEAWTYLLLAPGIIWLARLWFASWVEVLAARLDRKLVEGPATLDNPWAREVSEYLIGYVRRTGWDVDPALLARVIFLPGKQIDGVMSYGGGTTPVRVVIDRELLVLALGVQLDDRPDEKPARWPDWTIASVAPDPTGRVPSAAPSPHDFRGRKQKPSYPGIQRKPLGQAATLLGHATPAPGELVPLISDNPQDLAIVRELLSEHFPWFAPDPDEEFDATDPTDKDLLFGALVHELGAVRRNETQLATLRRALGKRVARVTTRARARLADRYAALNFARHHLIQYLYYRWTKDTELLTARARPARLHDVSAEILRRAGAAEKIPRPIRDRLAWLSQFFAEPLVDRRGVLAGRAAAGVAVAALLAGLGLAVWHAVAYHPIYVDRMTKELQKGPSDVETKTR